MELNFEIIELLKNVNDEPSHLIIFAVVHPFVLLILYVILLLILKKARIYKPKKNIGLFSFSIITISVIGMVLGFVSLMLFVALGVSGLKLFFIYLSMYLCITTFMIFNVKFLKKQVSILYNLKANQIKNK